MNRQKKKKTPNQDKFLYLRPPSPSFLGKITKLGLGIKTYSNTTVARRSTLFFIFFLNLYFQLWMESVNFGFPKPKLQSLTSHVACLYLIPARLSPLDACVVHCSYTVIGVCLFWPSPPTPHRISFCGAATFRSYPSFAPAPPLPNLHSSIS